MGSSFKVGTIGGIEIYVHWSWLLAFVFFAWSIGDFYHGQFKSWSPGTDYIMGTISALLLFVTVLVHELAHSFTARANNLPVNTITLFIFGGVSNLTREPQSGRIELLVAIAGPLASLAQAVLFFLLYLATRSAPAQIPAILGYLAWINVLLAVFNLIPGFPLDGGRVLRAVIWIITGNLRRSTHIASNVGQVIGYLFILGGLFEAFVLGAVLSGIWLAFIGWFLQNAASATYQNAAVDRLLMGIDVRDVMDPPPPDTPPTTAIEMLVYHFMLEGNERIVPINGPDGRLMGLVTLSDVRKVPREQWSTTPAHAIMTRSDELRTVSPDEDLRSAMQALAEKNYHQLPVLEDGRLVGILNRGHVLQYLHMRERLDVQEPTAISNHPSAMSR